MNLKPGDDQFFGRFPFQYTLSASYIKSFQNVVVSELGVPLKNFRPLKEFIACYDEDFIKYAFRYALKIFLKTRKVKADGALPFFLIFDNYSGPNGFFHWISDGLARLIEIKEEINNYTVIVPEYFRDEKFYMDTLSFFDVKNILFIAPGTSVKIKKLFISDFIAPSGAFHPQNAIRLRDFIWSKCSDFTKTSPAKSRLYISRSKASRRFITNEKEVEILFKEHDFQIIYMEDYSFHEQVNIVYNAQFLAGIHGGALTHIHFMRPDTNVFEFRKKGDGKNNCYYTLADVMKVNYYYQFCEGVEKSKNANNFDLLVDLEELKDNIQLMIKNSDQ